MKILNIILALCSLLVLYTCTEEDITTKPDGRELVSTFYQTDEQIILALNGAFDPFQHLIWGGNTFLWGSIASDDAVGGGDPSLTDNLGYQLADRFTSDPVEAGTHHILEEFYQLWWKMNTSSNAIIKYANNKSILGSKGIANAYFLKGMAYFQLTRMFGGLPIIDDIPGINSKFPRSTQEDTWAATERYLKTAIDATSGGYGLDVRTNMKEPVKGYATLGSAQALLGKVYLYQGKYTDAIDVLEKIVASGQYALEADYKQVFSATNKHGVESIFEINFTSQGPTVWTFLANGNSAATLVSPRAFSNTPTLMPDGTYSGFGMNQPTQKLVDAFDAMGDNVRKFASVISRDSIQHMLDLANLRSNWENVLTGYNDYKHSIKPGTFRSPTEVNQNIIVMRYSDVLLMLAEAYNRNNDDANALKYLNMVRERVGLPDADGAGDALFTKIKKERQLELCLEGDRYFDLVRWGDAATELTGEEYDAASGMNYSNKDGKPGVSTNGLFPIPFVEISSYGDFTGFPQNPGY
jgi:tetratricopeptide (TPR) repeat protein